MIDLLPNETLLFQIGIFLFTFISLNLLVFRPVLRLIARRKSLTVETETEARSIAEKTQIMMDLHQRKLQEARTAGIAGKEKSKKEGEAEAAKLAAQAKQEIDAELEKTRAEIHRQAKEAQLILRKTSRDLSREMVEKLLGRKVAS